eukprot:CAMPEP_0183511482 /NCGR_PEP_ID=MMETSP0371-20130417/10931_1 /TAXON_ID=268820 /ORGANISM="Peridinium aciculiferum, Strain PAER-2" /LENGTH=166 /DNA_ID=CAMNT_0025708411 /DNA_START=131 /DNA_END=630 /DNA_ORIENTATION=-
MILPMLRQDSASPRTSHSPKGGGSPLRALTADIAPQRATNEPPLRQVAGAALGAKEASKPHPMQSIRNVLAYLRPAQQRFAHSLDRCDILPGSGDHDDAVSLEGQSWKAPAVSRHYGTWMQPLDEIDIPPASTAVIPSGICATTATLRCHAKCFGANSRRAAIASS